METKKVISKITLSILAFLLFANLSFAADRQTISFTAKDSLPITADLYTPHPNDAPFIVLLHQAGWSRGEYIEIAPKLNKMGFNCMAVDLRSGGEVNKIKNLTHKRAVESDKPTNYLATIKDIKAAIVYVRIKYPEANLILWGSSYSAALAIKFAGDSADLIDGVLAFSPAEYFKRSSTYVTGSALRIKCPVFIASAQDEQENYKKIWNAIPKKLKHNFVPKTKGNHGSRALWKEFDDSKDYWKATTDFLNKYFPREKQQLPKKEKTTKSNKKPSSK